MKTDEKVFSSQSTSHLINAALSSNLKWFENEGYLIYRTIPRMSYFNSEIKYFKFSGVFCHSLIYFIYMEGGKLAEPRRHPFCIHV